MRQSFYCKNRLKTRIQEAWPVLLSSNPHIQIVSGPAFALPWVLGRQKGTGDILIWTKNWEQMPNRPSGIESPKEWMEKKQKEGWHCKRLKQLRTSKMHLIFSHRVHQPSADLCVRAWQYLKGMSICMGTCGISMWVWHLGGCVYHLQ